MLEALRATLDNTTRATQIFYETPHRIVEALEDIVAIFGAEHPIAIGRELTKMHEEMLRGTVA